MFEGRSNKRLREVMTMRLYRKNKQYDFEFPEDMELIMTYLNEHGTVLADADRIEDAYYRFSDSVCCAYWMSVSDEILEEFADWLDVRDL